MKKVIRRTAIVLVTLLVAIAAIAGGAVWMGQRKLERQVDVRVVPVAYTKDRAALKQGKYLFETRGCADCHGSDGRGLAFIDKPAMRVKSPNITGGPGGVVSNYNEGDWVRAIRHGVSPAGHALFLMPSEEYNRISDPDFAALVAYVRSLPPARGEPAEVRLPLIVKALYGAGIIKDASEKIDHKRAPPAPVPVGATVEHGAYVAAACQACHREHFEGGPVGGAPPEWPPAANLTPGGGVMARYDSAEKFVAMMRTGNRPDGSKVSDAMPFMSLRNMNDIDLNAVYAYLRSLNAAN